MCQDAWTTPVVISGYLATGHISGAITQIVCLAVDALIYVGFFKKADKKKIQEGLAMENK
ncbi:MAG TPA: hypothetical protein H9918_03000 [Candidatus Ligilactobacillus faecavium]|uniref:hypothetical protein n=1 Tax=Ligilactobacillus aviarius TaxID=1606 RepID=UPI001F9741BE|nr:hypothetical protein [Ligilactobacillus aviarius]HJD08749.1 hypothetical protein [Candidatus Ligilactobacillus faecavium]